MSEELVDPEVSSEVINTLEEIRGTIPTVRFSLIGSRETTPECLDWLYGHAIALMSAGGQGYSGGAEGADDALTRAVRYLLENDKSLSGYLIAKIFIGWYKFNNLIGGDLDWAVIDGSKLPSVPQAVKLAKLLHPSFDVLKPGAKALHTRNCFQVLDSDLETPVDVVIYAADRLDNRGRPLGGTATAWKLATVLNIPTFNVATPEGRDGFESWIGEHLESNKEMLEIYNKRVKEFCKEELKAPEPTIEDKCYQDEFDEDIQF